MHKLAVTLSVAVFFAFSLACEDSAPYDPDDDTCVDEHLGKLCVVNHTGSELHVSFDGIYCGIATTDGGECCMELDSYDSHTWEAINEGMEQSGDTFVPECDVRFIDVW